MDRYPGQRPRIPLSNPPGPPKHPLPITIEEEGEEEETIQNGNNTDQKVLNSQFLGDLCIADKIGPVAPFGKTIFNEENI